MPTIAQLRCFYSLRRSSLQRDIRIYLPDIGLNWKFWCIHFGQVHRCGMLLTLRTSKKTAEVSRLNMQEGAKKTL